MQSTDARRQNIVDKLRSLSPDRIAEVEDFVDFLRSRQVERELTKANTLLAEAAFRAVWENSDDADYDRL